VGQTGPFRLAIPGQEPREVPGVDAAAAAAVAAGLFADDDARRVLASADPCDAFNRALGHDPDDEPDLPLEPAWDPARRPAPAAG